MECLCTHDVETEVQRHGQPGENLLQNDHLVMANQLTTTSALIDSELMDVNLKPEVVTLPFLTITVADDVYPFLSMLTITVGIFANLYGNTTSCSSSLLTANVISTDPCCKLLL